MLRPIPSNVLEHACTHGRLRRGDVGGFTGLPHISTCSIDVDASTTKMTLVLTLHPSPSVSVLEVEVADVVVSVAVVVVVVHTPHFSGHTFRITCTCSAPLMLTRTTRSQNTSRIASHVSTTNPPASLSSPNVTSSFTQVYTVVVGAVVTVAVVDVADVTVVVVVVSTHTQSTKEPSKYEDIMLFAAATAAAQACLPPLMPSANPICSCASTSSAFSGSYSANESASNVAPAWSAFLSTSTGLASPGNAAHCRLAPMPAPSPATFRAHACNASFSTATCVAH